MDIRVKTKRTKKASENGAAAAEGGDQGKSKMELLELEMRAKAIKSLLEKKVSHVQQRQIHSLYFIRNQFIRNLRLKLALTMTSFTK